MTRISLASTSNVDATIQHISELFRRRVEATPPGMCPIALQLTLLQTSGAQTCGKCVPCRDGIPQLVRLLERIRDCQADESDLASLRELAVEVSEGSDCAIGSTAGMQVLESLDSFAAEYASHIERRHCAEEVAQKVPCEAMCPAHVNVPGYIALVAEGDCAGAVQMIRKDNPFPTACALVCEHPCEERCRRTIIDAPLNIRGIKKYAVDTCAADTVSTPERLPDSGKRIAVIGGGPSGLTCAYYSALMGHQVTVFEGRSRLGGMLRYGIPAYRFPRERLDEDVNAILAAGGIEVELDHPIGADEMREVAEQYDAVYVAIGSQGGKKLRIEGADADGVFSAVEMLGAIGDEEYPDYTGKRVAVIGGGNVAMDCCRTAVRCGASEVLCVYRRRREDMTALPIEIEGAMAEGVEMITLESPVAIEVDENGKVVALRTQPQMIGEVRGGRPAPVNAAKPEKRYEVEVVLIAVGQETLTEPFETFGMGTEYGSFLADEFLHAEGFDNVFVGGDCQTGPASAIKAIAAGKVAARNIDEFLGYRHEIPLDIAAPPPKPNDVSPKGRVNITERIARERKADFEYIENPMSSEEAAQECGRCLRCDHYGCGVLQGGRIQYV